MMLALCLVVFVVLTTGEALAAEGPSQTTQQGTVQSMTTINGKVAEPVAEKMPPVETPPVQTPPVQTPPVQTPPVQTPPPPTDKTPPAEEEPSPPPVARAPSTPEPEPVPASQPAPQWFAVVITEGETIEAEPVLTTTSWSTTDPDQASDVAYPAPDSATPLGASGSSYVPSTSTDAGAPGNAVEKDAVPTNQWASEPVLGSVASDQAAPESATQYPESVISLGTDPQSVPAASLLGKRGEPPIAVTRPSTGKPAPAFPTSVGGAPPLLSSLGTTAASAVGTVKNAAASVASATAEVLGSLTGVSPSNSSTNGTQEQPSEGTPQQPASAPPLAPPGGGGQFSLSTGGGGNIGPGGGFVPLLIGTLALLATSLLRRDFRTYLVSCEMPRPSSALLLPLERPG